MHNNNGRYKITGQKSENIFSELFSEGDVPHIILAYHLAISYSQSQSGCSVIRIGRI